MHICIYRFIFSLAYIFYVWMFAYAYFCAHVFAYEFMQAHVDTLALPVFRGTWLPGHSWAFRERSNVPSLGSKSPR